jgi:molybdopterin synthase sulfur carrier subunit
VKILFFARLRELLGSDYVEVVDAECPADVASLRALLIASQGGEFADALGDPNVFCAVNQQVVDPGHPLSGTDEIAFFPPMTGG